MNAPDRTDVPLRLTASKLVDRLESPNGTVDVVLDTDTYNEIDDQFALVYALLSDSLAVEAIYAAPFHNRRSTGPADGMEKSYDEIVHILGLLECSQPDEYAYRGATEYLNDADGSVESQATRDLIERAGNYTEDDPLYIVAIGTPTNVSAAIERSPGIIERIVVVWLGGNPHSWHTAEEFNLAQDVRASRVLFDSRVPLVHVPCKNVAEKVRTSRPELEAHIGDCGEVGEYLVEIFTERGQRNGDRSVWTKVIWDMAPIAYLLNPQWVPSNLTHSPILSEDCRYSRDESRHLIREAIDVRRDPVFEDFFEKLNDR